MCVALNIAIPVGKDSLSMKTVWRQEGETRTMVAPLSLIVSAFAPVEDVRRTLTPQLYLDKGNTALLLIDLGGGRNRLGGSCLAQVFGGVGEITPDIDSAAELGGFFAAIQELNAAERLLAYHDRSDGGLFVSLCEMAFASHCGIAAQLDEIGDDAFTALFAEEAGAVIQVREEDVP